MYLLRRPSLEEGGGGLMMIIHVQWARMQHHAVLISLERLRRLPSITANLGDSR